MRKSVLWMLCLAFVTVKAQTEDEKWNVGIHGGLNQYTGDLGNSWYSREQAAYGFGGGSVTRYLSKRFDLSLLATYGELGYQEPYSEQDDRRVFNSFLIRLATANLYVRYHLFDRESMVAPYLFGGGSLINQRDRSSLRIKRNRIVEPALPTLGAGLIVRFGPFVSLQFQEMFMHPLSDDVDHRAAGWNDLYVFHTVGLTFNLGHLPRKAQGSRAGNRIDRCDELYKNPKRDHGGCNKTKAKVREKKKRKK